MENSNVIEQIRRTWTYQRKVSNDFLDCIPADKWEHTPGPYCSPLSKQFRHMVWIYGAYLDAIRNQKIDLSKKKSYYSGELEPAPIKKALSQFDDEFEAILKNLESKDLDSFKIDFFGQQMGIIEFSHVMVQHECVHMGLWFNYAKTGDFETPDSWQSDWGL